MLIVDWYGKEIGWGAFKQMRGVELTWGWLTDDEHTGTRQGGHCQGGQHGAGVGPEGRQDAAPEVPGRGDGVREPQRMQGHILVMQHLLPLLLHQGGRT